MPNVAGRGRARLAAAALLALCGCALGLAAGSVRLAQAAAATLTITYTTPTSLQVTLPDGTAVKSGSVVPAGSYMVSVKDDPQTGDLNPNISISGPGVGLSNNLNSSGMGIDALSSFGPYTFQTSSSYSIEDSNLGASTLVTFTTSATSTAGSGGSTTTGSGSTGPTQTNGGTTTTSGSGTKAVKMIGTLKGSVSAAGTPTLTFDGKAVKTLKAGRYTVAVVDHATKAGLILEELSKPAMTLSGAATTAKSSHTVTLTAGKWFFQASKAGRKTYFTVTT